MSKYIFGFVDMVVKVIEDLEEKLEVVEAKYEFFLNKYEELKQSFNILYENNEFVIVIMYKVYVDLVKLIIELCGFVEIVKFRVENLVIFDFFSDGNCENLMEVV